MKKMVWKATTFVAMLLLAACGPPAKSVQPTAADSELATAATTLQRPPADRARVIIISGQTFRYTGLGGSYVAPHNVAGDIYVDDIRIGTLNHSEAMVFDLAPGGHTLRWITHKESLDTMTKRSKPSQHNLNGGSLLVLSTWYDSGYFVERPFEMMRASLDPRDHRRSSSSGTSGQLQIAPGILVVRPSDCPSTLCK